MVDSDLRNDMINGYALLFEISRNEIATISDFFPMPQLKHELEFKGADRFRTRTDSTTN